MRQKELKEEKMTDSIIRIGKSILQHGKANDRIYLIKLCKDDVFDIFSLFKQLVSKYNYKKIFAKVPYSVKQLFLDDDYVIEAHIPNFYYGTDDVFFMAKYFSSDRSSVKNQEEIKNVLKTALKTQMKQEIELKEGFYFKKPEVNDITKMVQLYKKVFESYPFPIFDPNYILETMHKNVDYFGIWKSNNIVAIASSEMDLDSQNTEMTDFATLPEYYGNNFSVYLLNEMEKDAEKRNIKTSYTIARSVSYGMNICFSKMGYTFTGTLNNNTNICGSLENMNVWYKFLT